jgi:hypothetical protein
VFGRWKGNEGSSLINPDTIDLVAETAEGNVELWILRDQPWSGSDEEVGSLQQKIHNYVGYAVDGQLDRDYPELTGRTWSIVVCSRKGAPDSRTAHVIETLQQRLPSHGGTLSHRLG